MRAKAIAASGIASVVLGAVLVIAPPSAGATTTLILNPGGNGNAGCSDLGYDVEARDNTQSNPGDTGTASGGGLVVNWTFEDDGTISFVVDEASDFDVSAALVKQGSAPSGGGVNAYEYDPAVSSDSGLVDPRGDEEFSHIAFCATTTTTTPTTEDTTTTTEGTTTTTEETTTTIEVEGEETENTTTTTEAEETTTTTEAEETTTTGVVEPAAEETQVFGETATRTLPRTGSTSQNLAVVGLALMIFGSVLVGGSRRALAGNS